jgi:hypothetical protein
MENLLKILFSNNIKYIVSVDDCYQENFTDVDDSLLLGDMVENLKAYVEKVKEINENFDIDKVLDLPEEIREIEIGEFLLELSFEEKKLLSSDISFEETLLKSQKENLLLFLNKLLTLEAINDYKTFDNINDAKLFLDKSINQEWNPSEENKVLWLIDREFGDRSNEGFRLLEEFSLDHNKWNIGILATQNTGDISEEAKFNSFLEKVSSNKLGENKNAVWLIEKSLITSEKSQELAKSIMHGLRRNYTFKITNFLSDTLRNGIQEASQEFKNIEQSTIYNIILKFSNQEGTSIIETLTRVLLALSKYDLNKKISDKYDDISKLISSYEALHNEVDIGQLENLEEVHQFRHKEKYNNTINGHFYPVGFGDIFEINDQKYILISQPCDIQVRGEKGERNLQQATLLKMSKEQPDNDAYATLNYFDRFEIYYVLFREALLIDFNILDLCSLNQDGRAKVALSQLGKSLESEYRYSIGQRKRLNDAISKLHDTYNRKESIMSTYNDIHKLLDESNFTNKEELISIIKDYKCRNDEYWDSVITINSFITSTDEINFPIRRISRLDELFTTNIMLEYSTNSSRLGLPGDYGSQFMHTEYKIVAKNPQSYFGKEPMLLSVNQTQTILLNQSNIEIIQNVFSQIIKGNVSKENEDIIAGSPQSYININKKDKIIIIPSDYFVETGKEICSFLKGCIILKKDVILSDAPSFYRLISELIGQNDIIKENNLFPFYKGRTLNEKISFKLNQFEDQIYTVQIDGIILLIIRLEIEERDDGKFNIHVNVSENEENIKRIYEKLTVR